MRASFTMAVLNEGLLKNAVLQELIRVVQKLKFLNNSIIFIFFIKNT